MPASTTSAQISTSCGYIRHVEALLLDTHIVGFSEIGDLQTQLNVLARN